tara:strand:+ start:229 stop:1296 length:1068 start_codon:yes stop_codon:yes gene_type:complete
MGSKSKSSSALAEPPAKRSKSSKSSKSGESNKPRKSSKSGKSSKEKRRSKPAMTDKEKEASREASRAKRAAAREAKRKQAESESDREESGSEDEEGEEGEGEDERLAVDPADINDDDVMEDVDKEGKTQTEIDKDAKKLANTKAKCRGYRTVANRGGFSAQYDSGYAHLDVATPILSEGEVKRAAKWAPLMEQHASFGNLTEFEERTQLALEPLPPASVRVIRNFAEPFLRRLVTGAFQRASDQQKTGIRIAEVVAETRPLQRVLKYSFVAPHGLIRYAQTDNNGGDRLNLSVDDKSEEVQSAEKELVKQQKTKRSELKKEKQQKLAEKVVKREEKKRAAAAAKAAAAAAATGAA